MGTIEISRLPDWNRRLGLFLEYQMDRAFDWEKNNCCLMFANAVEVMTGVDMGAWFRGRCDSRGEAFQAIREYSGGSVVQLFDRVAEEFGIDEIEAENIGIGDYATIKTEPFDPIAGRLSGGVTVGICTGPGYFVLQGIEGLVFLYKPEVVKAWRI